MNYRIVAMPSGNCIVYDVNDVAYGNYDTEAKAKRRIRDLKAKELTAGVHGNLVVPAFDVMSTIDADFAESFERPVRQVGCYPAVSKHIYQR